MSTTTTQPKSILFISATGGIALATLKRCLAAPVGSLTITVLARSPTRLQALLSPTELSSPSLRIVEGNAHSVSDIVSVLTHPSDATKLVDIILTGIGAKPDLKKMSVDDPHVCEKGMKSLMDALTQVTSTSTTLSPTKPYIIAVSAAGASTLVREYPVALYPVHALLLKGAIKDKRAMERMLAESEGEKWTVIRPSMLTDKPVVGLDKVRVSTEDLRNKKVEGEGVVVGYTVSREDVGGWIFERLIMASEESERGTFEGRAVVLSY